MRISIYFFILSFIMLSSFSDGQEIADTAFEKTVFWRITANGLKYTSYLFGTDHPIFKEDILIPDSVLHIFLRSSVVFFENIPSSNPDSLYREIHTMKKPRLKRLLGNICYKKLIDRLRIYNDPILKDPSFNRFTPDYMNARIMKNVFGKRLTAIDDSLISIARKNDLEMFALDDDHGISKKLEDPTTYDLQATTLYTLLSDFDKNIADYIQYNKSLTQKYLSGDIVFIYNRTNFIRINNNWSGQSFIVRKSGREWLLDERNKNWLPKIEGACKTQSSFFAFGAGHLAGTKGIISLLRKKGYTVTPIFLKNK